MEEQPESVASTDRRNKSIKEKGITIEAVIEDVNSQEDIDLLIARLQAKKYQKKMMNKSTDRAIATKGEMLLPQEEPLDWDNIQG